MQVLLILAHPQEGSFNHALARAAADRLTANGHDVVMHDLYREGFDPVLPGDEIARGAALLPLIARHCAEIAAADGIIVVHPNWWGMPPAILTGWVDRIVRPGVAYEFLEGDSGEGVPRGLLKARVALVLNTSNTVAAREQAVFGDPLERIWKDCVFGLCGVSRCERRMFGVVATSSPAQRADWLAEAAAMVDGCFPPEPGGGQ